MILMPARAVLGFIVVLYSAPALADEPTTKPAVPTAVALRKATAAVDQQYKEDVARARDADSKSVLAKRILDAAKDEEKPDVKYALLNKAMQSAIAAGDAATASETVDRIDETWQIDGAKLRAETLVKTSRSLRSPDDQLAFVHLVQPMVDKAMADKKYDAAKSLNDAAVSAAQRGNDPNLAKEMTARGAEIVERRTAESRVGFALTVLKTKPDDPAANATVGKYQCYIEDNWAEGLAKLSHGNDTTLKGLAAKELAEDATPESKTAAADGWWDIARRESELARRHIQLHATNLYKDALPHLTGTTKQKVDKRLAEMTDIAAPKPIALSPSLAPAMPAGPKIAVKNLSRATEAQAIIDAVGRDSPDALKDLTAATLLYYRDASQLSHGQGGSRPLKGAYSTSPTISTAPTFLFFGLSDPFKPGKYLVVYRVQLITTNGAATVFQTDVYFQGEALGRHMVKASEAPVGEWKTIAMITNVTMPLNGEYRIYAGKNAAVALDRVYVFAVQ